MHHNFKIPFWLLFEEYNHMGLSWEFDGISLKLRRAQLLNDPCINTQKHSLKTSGVC